MPVLQLSEIRLDIMKKKLCVAVAREMAVRAFLPDHMRRGAISLPAFLILLFFGLSLLLPHGVGFQHPFGLPNIDLPRIAVLSLNLAALLLVVQFRNQLTRFFEPAPLVQWLLIFIGVWQFIAAAFSSSPRGALLWAFGNWLTLWGLAFVTIAAGQSKGYWDTLAAILKIVVLIVMIWAALEWVTQGRIISYRNTWSWEMTQSSLELYRVYRLSVGPYPNNHYLSLILCTLGGFVLVSRRGSLLKSSLLVAAVASTGLVAGFVAFFGMLTANLLLERRLAAAWPLFLFLVFITTISIVDSHPYAFLTSGIHASFTQNLDTSSMPSMDASLIPNVSSTPIHRGSFIARLMNTWSVLEQVLQHPLFGFGPGAITDIAKVHTSLQCSTDLGSLFLHITESGLPIGFALLATLVVSLVRGYRSRAQESRAAALGLTGFVIITISSPVTYFWGLAFVLCGVISFYSRSGTKACGSDIAAETQ